MADEWECDFSFTTHTHLIRTAIRRTTGRSRAGPPYPLQNGRAWRPHPTITGGPASQNAPPAPSPLATRRPSAYFSPPPRPIFQHFRFSAFQHFQHFSIYPPMLHHLETISRETGIAIGSVASTAKLLAEGGTVPFISRYRKEQTGSLDEVQITTIRDRMVQLAELDTRRSADPQVARRTLAAHPRTARRKSRPPPP